MIGFAPIFLFCDWMCANKSHLSDWLVGSVQIHCCTGPAACPTAVLSHLESGGRISAEHSADICRFLLSPQQHQIENSIYQADIQHPDIWLGSLLVPYHYRPEAAATARQHPTKPPRQKQEEEELPPEPAIRKADIRRISKTSGMGFVNFAKHIITKIIIFNEIITALWYQTIKNNHKTLLLSFFSIFFVW